MTQDIDLKTMTTDKEITTDISDELEVKMKDIFIWALGEAAATVTTKTMKDNDGNKMNIHPLYCLFRLHFIPIDFSFTVKLISSGLHGNQTRQQLKYGRECSTQKKSVSLIMLRQPN